MAQDGPAPRDSGWWGELGYRIERSLRLRERDTAQERIRLAQFLSAIEASPNGVMMLDANEQIAWCNSQAADRYLPQLPKGVQALGRGGAYGSFFNFYLCGVRFKLDGPQGPTFTPFTLAEEYRCQFN